MIVDCFMSNGKYFMNVHDEYTIPSLSPAFFYLANKKLYSIVVLDRYIQDTDRVYPMYTMSIVVNSK